MKQYFLIVIFLMVVIVSSVFGAVNIPDANLRAVIEEYLGKASGAEITEDDMARLTGRFWAVEKGIKDLTGLESAVNVEIIDLWTNEVTDLSPLAQLTNLKQLHIGRNKVTSLSPIANLTNLEWLDAGWNPGYSLSPLNRLTKLRHLHVRAVKLTNISTLSRLTNLTFLDLGQTGLSSISTVRTLTKLNYLYAGGNSISNISSLSGLINLRKLTLESNNISDIAPLVANQGLGKGDQVRLQGNPLSAASINTHIPALRDRGVKVKERWTNRDVSGDGRVDVTDLLLVWLAMSQPDLVGDRADVNGDGSVDIWDLVLVAQQLGEWQLENFGVVTAPAATLGAADVSRQNVETWITAVQTVSDGSALFSEALENLNHLLELLPPEQTRLLPNYPNPFNPETWIPYQLAQAADVQIAIYDVQGELVRRLELGHQQPGYHTDRTKAAYWDGRNEFGELVGSGAYFYHLSAGDYSATRKMVILK